MTTAVAGEEGRHKVLGGIHAGSRTADLVEGAPPRRILHARARDEAELTGGAGGVPDHHAEVVEPREPVVERLQSAQVHRRQIVHGETVEPSCKLGEVVRLDERYRI